MRCGHKTLAGASGSERKPPLAPCTLTHISWIYANHKLQQGPASSPILYFTDSYNRDGMILR